MLLAAPGVWNVEGRAMTMAAGPAGLSLLGESIKWMVISRSTTLLEGRPLEYYHYQYAGRHTASPFTVIVTVMVMVMLLYSSTDTPEEKEKR